MTTIQWRPEINALTTPQSYRILFLPRNVVGTKDMAARMAAALPNYSEKEFRAFIDLHNQLIAESLSNGEQVTEENAFTYSLSFTGRLDSPEAPLPPLEECLQVRIYASQPFVNSIRQVAKTERLPMEKKLPIIATAQDTVLNLNDVLNPQGLLNLTGNNLSFDRTKPDAGGCVIEGTQSGKTVQHRFGKIENSEVSILPDIPEQDNPWNNEYIVSLSTRYSKQGTLRTGTYGRMLRTPLTLSNFSHPNPPEVGILTGSADSPYVSVTSGSVTADETLRIQVVLDMRSDSLRISLLDMQEDGRTGPVIAVTANGEYSLPGFADSAVNSLSIRVNEYTALKEMSRKNYSGRIVDILQIEMT